MIVLSIIRIIWKGKFMRKIIFFLLFITINISALENKFFTELSYKKIATFNDAITLMRLLYNENDNNSTFIDNVIWAASKKLFRVTLPITEDQVNPLITRKELSYWICGVLNLAGNKNNETRLGRYQSYKLCVNLGIIDAGRGADDNLSGWELLNAFAYLDYYVRYNKITTREDKIEKLEEDYQYFPEWRKILYKEFDEQREAERREREAKKIKKQNKQQKDTEFEQKFKKDNKDKKLNDVTSDSDIIENIIEE